jgi:hypothetical protein
MPNRKTREQSLEERIREHRRSTKALLKKQAKEKEQRAIERGLREVEKRRRGAEKALQKKFTDTPRGGRWQRRGSDDLDKKERQQIQRRRGGYKYA